MPSKDGSVAPKERVNITYRPATGGAQEDVELPLKILLLGDFTGRPDGRAVEERAPINVDKDNFDQVMTAHNLEVNVTVPNRLMEGDAGDLSATLRFNTLADFRPEAFVQQVAPLRQLMEFRTALATLKGPLSNQREFRQQMVAILKDPDKRARLLRELGLEGDKAE